MGVAAASVVAVGVAAASVVAVEVTDTAVVAPAKRFETRAEACTCSQRRLSNSGRYCCRKEVSHRIHSCGYRSHMHHLFMCEYLT